MAGAAALSIAFVAGLVSFLAPCVLPLIPGYIAYLAGTSLRDAANNRSVIFLNGFLFVFGFSTVFALLGILLNGLLEAAAYDVQQWLARIGGVVIIFFGLYLTELFHIPWLEREHKIRVNPSSLPRYFSSLLFGAAFAAGWTPCAGAALGSILGLASSEPGNAFILLMAYAIGFGLPFLLISLFISQSRQIVAQLVRVVKPVRIIFGLFLILFGIAVFTQMLSRYANIDLINAIVTGR